MGDIFLEKIVQKRKDAKDYLIIAGIIIAALILMFFAVNFVPGMSLFFLAGIGYISYLLITTRNIEYEYAVTNGDLDIDKIIAQRKRKRIFSANCKNFEIVAKLKSPHFSEHYKTFRNQMDCTSSLNSDNVYFIVLNYKNEQTVVYFEPSEKMLNSFKTFIPRKVFID
ncbi:MAG: hypothetical protein GXZ01_07050 [Clostridiaceae bacterium]|nr:hypothetical protein [Clostridiaceae bacterium]